MRAAASLMAVASLALFSSACGAHATQGNARTVSSPQCAGKARSSECTGLPRRVGMHEYMTWNQYYTSVMDEAFRRNSSVVWINPPRPIRRLVAEQAGSMPDSNAGITR